jgi:KilA-N domain
MSAKVLKFVRPVNGISVEQRFDDGFIHGTAMTTAHGKNLNDWFTTKDTFEIFLALAGDLGILVNFEALRPCMKAGVTMENFKAEINCGDFRNLDFARLSGSKYARIFPGLIFSKRGAPAIGGGSWLHPDLAVYLAQWCNKPFAIQVSRWVREWLTTYRNPIQEDIDQEYVAWQQRHDIRVYLKDILRPELMNEVRDYAIAHKLNPIKLCSEVHDTMNERIQGARSQALKAMGGLPLASLLRDYFATPPLHGYSTITQLVKVAIVDHGVEPIQAVHDACDSFFGKSYSPKPVPIVENLYKQGRRLRAAKRVKQLSAGIQLNFLEQGEAC